jgi:putative acetyltransferase
MTISIRTYQADDQAEMVRIWLDASFVGQPFLGEDDLQKQLVLVRDIYLPKAWARREKPPRAR